MSDSSRSTRAGPDRRARRHGRRHRVRNSTEAYQQRRKQLQHQIVLERLPILLLLTLLCTLLVVAVLPPLHDTPLQQAWLGGLALLGAGLGWLWWRWHYARSHQQPQRRLWSAESMARFSGAAVAFWLLGPLLLLDLVPAAQQSLVSLALLGMLCSTTTLLSAVPLAAWTTLTGFSLGLLVTLLRLDFSQAWPSLLPWLFCVAMAAAGVQTLRRLLNTEVVALVRADQQDELISLMLDAAQEKGRDLPWQIDAQGQLVQVTPPLASALRCTDGELEGRKLLVLLGELQQSMGETERHAVLLLRDRLTEGQPFSHLLVPLVIEGQHCWWSFSAKPVVDEAGRQNGWRGVLRDVSQSRSNERRLAWLEHFDPLTGLNNRAHFRVQLEQALQQRMAAAPPQGAVLCLDLDNFRSINDTLGHATGDALLVSVAERLRKLIDEDEAVARLGGDTFALLLPGAHDEARLRRVGQRVVEALRQPGADHANVQIRVSIGVARYPQDGNTVDQLLQCADLALEQAKDSTSGGLSFYTPAMAELALRRQGLERDLRAALAREQLRLEYQPKIAFGSWDIIGFEALLRWQHPELGDIPPGEFIPMAENHGLMPSIGAWVLAQACRTAASWPVALQVSINLAPSQLLSADLAATLARELGDSQLDPARLELEITESVFINEVPGRTIEQLHALQQQGVRIALDDFGTGYSSLSYLRRFPFNTLKIDRAFVRELLAHRDARALVRNILALGRSLRMTTVAEGVEEPAQLQMLQAEGCDQLQGYLISRPLPP
ncbi:MAG: hypothetical protein RJA44_219, partial [Pseudomonadota bacterium]